MTSNAPFRFEVEFGVRSDVINDTMSDVVKLAKVIDESHDVGQPTPECQLIWLSRRKLVAWIESLFVQGGAKGTEKSVLALMAWPSREGWLHGESTRHR